MTGALRLENINTGQIEDYVTWVWDERDSNIGSTDLLAHSNDDWIPTCHDCGHRVKSVVDGGPDWHLRSDTYEEIPIDDGLYRYAYTKTPICRDCVDKTTNEYGGWETLEDETETACVRLDATPSSVVCELGKVQRAVLMAVFELSGVVHPFDHDGDAWVDRVNVTRRISSAEYYNASSANALSAGVSRAVHSLIDRGLLSGAYRAWHTYHGDAPPMNANEDMPWSGYQGGDPSQRNENDKPTIEKLRFRMVGLRAAALISDYLNGGGTE